MSQQPSRYHGQAYTKQAQTKAKEDQKDKQRAESSADGAARASAGSGSAAHEQYPQGKAQKQKAEEKVDGTAGEETGGEPTDGKEADLGEDGQEQELPASSFSDPSNSIKKIPENPIMPASDANHGRGEVPEGQQDLPRPQGSHSNCRTPASHYRASVVRGNARAC